MGKRKGLKTVEEGKKNFSEKVGKTKRRYVRSTERGFRDKWSLWYNYMMYRLLTEYDTWSAIEDPHERALQVQEFISEASKDYRAAKVKLFAKEAAPEIRESKRMIDEVAAETIDAILAVV